MIDLKKLPSYQTRDYIGWNPYGDYMCNRNGWTSRLEYTDWQQFISEFENADDDMNVVVDFYFDQNEYDSHGYLIPLNERTTDLNMWLLHPRKGASRGVCVKKISEDDIPKIKSYMSRQYKTIKKWFKWIEE